MPLSNSTVTNVSISINDTKAQKKLADLKERLARVKAERDSITQKPLDLRTDKEAKRLLKLNDELKGINEQISKTRLVGEQVAKTLSNLDTASVKDLRATIKALRREMESGSIERGSKEWDQYAAALQEAKAALKTVQDEMKGVTDAGKENKGALDGLKKAWDGLQKALALVDRGKSFIEGYVQSWATISDEFVSITNYTGMVGKDIDELDKALLKLDTRTSHQALLQLAEDAGKLGIRGKENILEFVKAADTINLSIGGALPEDAVRNIAKLAELFGDDKARGLEASMVATASAINNLAASSSASESQLVEFASSLGTVGSQAGFTQAEILGIGGALERVGASPNAAAFQKMLIRLLADPAKAAQAAGLEVKAFTDLLNTDANAALLKWAQGMAATNQNLTDAAPVLKSMRMQAGGTADIILALAHNLDEVHKQQKVATEAFDQGTSALDQAAVANSSAAAEVEKLQKRSEAIREEIGRQLLPAYVELEEQGVALSAGFARLVSIVAPLIPLFARLVPAIIAAKAASVLLQAAIASKTSTLIAARAVWAGLLVIWGTGCKTAAALAAATNLGTIATKANTLATKALTGATKAYTTAVNVATKATNALSAAEDGASGGATILWKILLKLAVFIASYLGINKLLNAMTEAETEAIEKETKARDEELYTLIQSARARERNGEAIKSELDNLDANARAHDIMTDAEKKATESSVEERMELQRLYQATQDQTLSMDQRTAAAQAMINKYPAYFDKLSTEEILAGRAADAYADLTNQIIAAAKARAMEEEIVKIEHDNIELRQKLDPLRTELGRRDLYTQTTTQQQQNRGMFDMQFAPESSYYSGGANHWRSTPSLQGQIEALEKQIAANVATQEQLASEATRLRGQTQAATDAADGAMRALTTGRAGTGSTGSTGGGGGRSRSGGGSGRTSHTSSAPKETPQQEANRLRQERLELAQKLLGRDDLSTAVTAMLAGVVKAIQADIAKNPQALLPEARQRQTEQHQAQEAYLRRLEDFYRQFATFDKLSTTQQRALLQNLDAMLQAAQAEAATIEQRIASADTEQDEISELVDNLHRVNQQVARLSQIRERIPVSSDPLRTYKPTNPQALSPAVSVATFDNEALGLSERAAQTLSQNLQTLRADLEEGILTANGYREALDNLYREAARSTALEDLEDKIKKIDQAEQAGIISTQRATTLRAQARREREEAVRALSTITTDIPAAEDPTASTITGIYKVLTARREAFAEVERLEQQGIITHEEAEKRKTEISQETSGATVAAANMAYQQIANFAQQYTAYLNAQRDAEVQRVTAQYDNELARLKEGTAQYKDLEEKKQAAVAAVKNKYNKRAQAIELAQALASVALSAINAYSSAVKVPIVGSVLAPIAAATAVAAGMLQVATIRKQHEAQAQGYAEGGFTPRGRKYEPAGIVHKGEFVANQEAVKNPALRPLFEALDQAQKKRIVSRITPDDLFTTSAGAVRLRTASEPKNPQTQEPTNQQTHKPTNQSPDHTALLSTLERLNTALERGTIARVALDGADGLHQQYTRFKRLRGNV